MIRLRCEKEEREQGVDVWPTCVEDSGKQQQQQQQQQELSEQNKERSAIHRSSSCFPCPILGKWSCMANDNQNPKKEIHGAWRAGEETTRPTFERQLAWELGPSYKVCMYIRSPSLASPFVDSTHKVDGLVGKVDVC